MVSALGRSLRSQSGRLIAAWLQNFSGQVVRAERVAFEEIQIRFFSSGGDSYDIVLMLQQGQHRAVRGLLVEAQIMVLSATRYHGDPSPQCWTAGQTRPSIREILVGLWWIRTARLVYHLTIYNETYLFGRKTYAEIAETTTSRQLSMWWLNQLNSRQWASTQQSSLGLWALFTMISCVMQSSIDYCPLLPHLKHPGHKGLLLRCHPTPYHLQLGYFLRRIFHVGCDTPTAVCLRGRFTADAVSRLQQSWPSESGEVFFRVR